MSRAWMPLYWGDYLRDTRDLSTLQHGAYLLLMGHYWQHEGLPTDERQLAAIAGLPLKTWRQISPAIAAKFQKDWRHRRIDAEIVKADRALMQRRIAGAKGGHRTAVTRAIAVGSALAAAQARPWRAVAASAAASARADGPAKTQPPVSNHNHIKNYASSESSAARVRDERLPTPPDRPEGPSAKRPSELSRAEIDAIHACRRAATPQETPGEKP
jgi:uncharacterized protein YdaU (DUF1376 family)